MRLLRMFGINFQRVLEHRTSNFVWFLVSIVNPLILLVYWIGFYKSQGEVDYKAIASITGYYLILAFVNSLLMVHIEEDVAYNDIQLGGLTGYLLRPFSYIKAKFIYEMPWRILQSTFGLVVLIFVLLLVPGAVIIDLSFLNIIQTLIIFIFALFLSFYFKMLAGISAFWLIDFSGFEQLLSIIVLLLAGYIMPVNFFPEPIKQLAFITPFPYMVYYPVISLQGKLVVSQFLSVISIQLFWILFFKFSFNYFWNKGMKKFAGVGD